eukprot:g56925.t1
MPKSSMIFSLCLAGPKFEGRYEDEYDGKERLTLVRIRGRPIGNRMVTMFLVGPLLLLCARAAAGPALLLGYTNEVYTGDMTIKYGDYNGFDDAWEACQKSYPGIKEARVCTQHDVGILAQYNRLQGFFDQFRYVDINNQPALDKGPIEDNCKGFTSDSNTRLSECASAGLTGNVSPKECTCDQKIAFLCCNGAYYDSNQDSLKPVVALVTIVAVVIAAITNATDVKSTDRLTPFQKSLMCTAIVTELEPNITEMFDLTNSEKC